MTDATQTLGELVKTQVIETRTPLEEKLSTLPGFALMRVTEMLLDTGAGAIAQAAQELGVLSNTTINMAPDLKDDDLTKHLPAWLNVVSTATLRVVNVVIVESGVGFGDEARPPRVRDTVSPSIAPPHRLLTDVTLTILHDRQRKGWQPLFVAQSFSPWRSTQLAFHPYVIHPKTDKSVDEREEGAGAGAGAGDKPRDSQDIKSRLLEMSKRAQSFIE